MEGMGLGQMIRINVKVIPGASRNIVVGLLGDSLKVKVSVPAEGGKANKAVIRLLAEWLQISMDQVLISSGHQSPKKIVDIHSVTPEQYQAKLDDL